MIAGSDTASPSKSIPRKKLRWYQFSLRKFVIVVAFLCVVVAYLAMPGFAVRGFMKDVNGRNMDRAYRNTSESFQGYIPRQSFDSWVEHLHVPLDPGRYNYGRIQIDDEWKFYLNLDTRHGNDRLVFVWENYGWKFKHVTQHWD